MALLGALAAAFFVPHVSAQQDAKKATGPQRWESAIAAFEKQDQAAPPAAGGVVFVGSSSIRLWNLKKWFPELPAVNRGFGGSEVIDSLHFADRIVLPYKPRVVVMYAGDNDIAKGTTPEQVAQHFEQFVAKLEKALPETKIVYVAIKPSIKRWNLIDKVRDANSRIRKVCDSKRQLEFVDIDPPMLGDDGQPRPELFAKDGLHLSDDGYKLWTSLVQPHLK